MTPLIQPEALRAALGRPGLAVLDATYFLPNENEDAAANFIAAHIPGAHFFDIDKVADTASGLPHMLPSPEMFAATISAMGIGDATQLVVYDQRGIFSAPRLWWMFRVFGHDNVQVLDGGLPGWIEAGGATEAGAPAPAAPGISPRASGRRWSAPWIRCAPISRTAKRRCWMPVPPRASTRRCPNRARE